MPRHRVALGVAVAFLVCGCRAAPSGGGAPGVATVVRVIDGDTVIVDVGGREESIRLIGIDTPESVDPNRPVECNGPEASHHLDELLPAGTEVRLERDEEARDRYGRLLAYVFRTADGLFVNLQIATVGDAEVLSIPPNTAYAPELGAAVADARRSGRGMWGACDGL